MDKWIELNYHVVIYVLSGGIVAVTSLLGFFIKSDRRRFFKLIAENVKDITEVKEDLMSVKVNYNTKFEKVYSKQDELNKSITTNHLSLMKAIHEVDIKVTSLGSR